MIPEYDFQVLKLTQEFYNKYTNPPYVEIEIKENCSENLLCVMCIAGYLFDRHYSKAVLKLVKQCCRRLLDE